MFTEQQVTTAAKMYEMRKAARSIFGDGYAVKVAPWKLAVAHVQKQLKCAGPIQAALLMAIGKAGHRVDLNEFDTLLLVSAATDLCEEGQPQPSTARPPDGGRASNPAISSSTDQERP